MATRTDIRDFISMVTSGFIPLQDLIVTGQQMGLNAEDTIEIVATLQPDMVPSNIMASMNAPSMVDNTYTAPRIGFEEATQLFDVPTLQEPLQRDPDPAFGFQATPVMNPVVMESRFYDEPKDMPDEKGMPGETYSSSRMPPPPARIPMGEDGYVSPPKSMSDIINTNLQASQAEVDSMTQPSADQPIIQEGFTSPPRVNPVAPVVPPRPVDFSGGDTQTGMMDAAATLRSPFTSDIDRRAAQDYMSGIVSNIRLPF
jgi:hypothetical protein